jgi:AcrR family transcriptional regulator
MADRKRQSAGGTRREKMLDAAIGVFLRYGFKKTSMDDVAGAAGFSRQALYLNFKTKEQLFEAALEHLVSRSLAEARALAANEEIGAEDRILAIFESLHRETLENASRANASELVDVARSAGADFISELERGFAGIVADVLNQAGIAARWQSTSITANHLAKHLFAAASGIKASADNLTAYRAQMRLAIRIIGQGA